MASLPHMSTIARWRGVGCSAGTASVELAGGEALFPTDAAAHDPAVYGGSVPAGACGGFPDALDVAWAGFLVAEGFRGEEGRGPMCSPPYAELRIGPTMRSSELCGVGSAARVDSGNCLERYSA